MKNKGKAFCFVLIILSVINILLCFFVFTKTGSKEISIYSRNESTIRRELNKDDIVKFNVTLYQEDVKSIRIGIFLPEAKEYDGDISYKLYSGSEVVSSGNEHINNIIITGEILISMPENLVSLGESYSIEIYTEDAPQDLIWVLWENDEGVVSSAFYDVKTRPYLWYSLMVFAIIFTVSSTFLFSGDNKKNEEH